MVEDVASQSVSDHAPEALRSGQRHSRSAGVGPIPRRVTRNLPFGELLREGIHRLLPHGPGVFEELGATVSLMHLVARQLRAESSERVARTDEERVHWTLVQIRS